MLYQPFPDTWPDFSPRDKLADWLEQYATTQDLVVWTSSELRAHPRFDESSSRWDVIVIRDGTEVSLRPSHVVIATGYSGRPVIPPFPALDRFQGQHMHSSKFPGGALFAGKHAVVVGAGNSAIDICQDLVLKGAESVTMIQRSATCVLSRDFVNAFLRENFPESQSLAISDMKYAALPMPLLEKLMTANKQTIEDIHAEMYNDLRKAGLRLTLDGGPLGMYWDKGGGTFVLHFL